MCSQGRINSEATHTRMINAYALSMRKKFDMRVATCGVVWVMWFGVGVVGYQV